jgi:hypothetical protein
MVSTNKSFGISLKKETSLINSVICFGELLCVNMALSRAMGNSLGTEPKNVFEKPPWPPNSGGKVFKVPQVCRSFSEEI